MASLTRFFHDSLGSKQVQPVVGQYLVIQDAKSEEKSNRCVNIVNHYYDLVTDFYEYGWGQCFHFAPRYRDESFDMSLLRHELYLAHRLHLQPGMKVLDVGCGVGGPMRAIARFSGAHVIGVNNNAYQIRRGQQHIQKARLQNSCEFMKADFMNMSVPSGTYDGAYTIEAAVHAPNKTRLFSEIYRVLKPGAGFVGYDWCLTDQYCPENPQHRQIKKEIEVGNGLIDMGSTNEVLVALKEAGFDSIEGKDIAVNSDVDETPWYLPLSGNWSVSGFKHTRLGRWLTHRMIQALETFFMAPKGTMEVSRFLMRGADALVQGGEMRIFTPCFFFYAQKPHVN